MSKPIILNAAELPERTQAELASLFTVLDLPKAMLIKPCKRN
jgi:hypothetical protein